jgi:hypothetical protein
LALQCDLPVVRINKIIFHESADTSAQMGTYSLFRPTYRGVLISPGAAFGSSILVFFIGRQHPFFLECMREIW